MSQPRAFVVMPFRHKSVRPANGAERELVVDFDAVHALLIAPALVAAGCEPFRADQEASAGDIRTDMFFELVTADLVLADISILNANVFYELGVRHGVTPRGVLMIHGGWSMRPFDVAPDRTLDYPGELFVVGSERTAAWKQRVDEQVARLGRWIAGALAVDQQTIASPVYKEVVGLKPADWSGVQTARFKYFHGVLDDWKQRVFVARAAGRAGDILTLAGDAPTRYHQDALRFEAARALVELERYEVAEQLLRQPVSSERTRLDVQCQLGVVLGRLGRHAEAESLLRTLSAENVNRQDAQGKLGRVYKDGWKQRWLGVADPKERRTLAARTAASAAQAVRCYAKAARHNLNEHYTAVNLVGLARLLAWLEVSTGFRAPVHGVTDIEAWATVAQVVATQALEGARERGDANEAVWAGATLGELALVDECDDALARYRDASAEPGVTWFHLTSMLQQLELYAALDFQRERVEACIAAVREGLALNPRPPEVRGRIAVFSGHMVDAPGRTPPRFPASKVDAVRAELARILERWRIGAGDVAICGGACGGDMLFAELCLERGAAVELCLPVSRGEFLANSVRVGGADWEQRFFALAPRATVLDQVERLGPAPSPDEAFTRNNRWMLDIARTRAPSERILAAVVWDGLDSADGAGGTVHFKRAVERLGTTLAVVDPTKL